MWDGAFKDEPRLALGPRQKGFSVKRLGRAAVGKKTLRIVVRMIIEESVYCSILKEVNL